MAAEIIVKVLIERKNEQSGGNVVTKAETEIFLLSRESLEKNERVMDYTRFLLSSKYLVYLLYLNNMFSFFPD